MFNWVCPRCGKDVPSSRDACPNCGWSTTESQAQQTSPVVGQPVGAAPTDAPPPQVQSHGWQPPPPPQSQQAPPPPPMMHQHSPYEPPHAHPHDHPHQHAPWAPPQAHRHGPPAWAMGLLFALAFMALFAAVYYGIQRFGRTNPSEKAGLENPANPSHEKVANPMQKFVEVVGIRLIADNKKPAARFVVVNHSNSDITDLSANVTLWASTSRSEEDSIGTFSFKVRELGPNGSQELTAPLKTKLKMYELPDWQNSTAEIQITTP